MTGVALNFGLSSGAGHGCVISAPVTSLLRLDISGEWCRRVFNIAYRWGSMFERHVDKDWSLLTIVR
jgi:hypothetical protein